MRVFLTTLTMVVLGATAGLAADAKAGQAVYDKSCKMCHGADGTAPEAMSKMMKVEIKDLKSADVQKLSDADLKKVSADGKGKMPPKHVTGADADNLVAFIRTLKK